MNGAVTNPVVIYPIFAWWLAQVAKIGIHYWRHHEFAPRLFISAGGMPSSHSAFVCALATSVALAEGMGSVAFAISVVLAFIVMYDAAGVRQSVGEQSVVLNRILRELRLRRPVEELGRDIREFIGHTSFQVIVGGLLGVGVTFSWFAITGTL